MKTIRVDFNSIDEDGLVRSHLSKANSTLFVGDQVFAFDTEGNSSDASVVSINNGSVKIVCLARQLVAA